MTEIERLRPVERRVLRWVDAGLADAEIGRRFGRSEQWAAQVQFLSGLDRTDRPDTRPPAGRLRPIERRVLRWRDQGVDYDELSGRFRRSPDALARIEEYANYKLAAAGPN